MTMVRQASLCLLMLAAVALLAAQPSQARFWGRNLLGEWLSVQYMLINAVDLLITVEF